MVSCNLKMCIVTWQLGCETTFPLEGYSDRLCRSAWHGVGKLSEESAREQYVRLVALFFPIWDDECTSYHPQAALAGPVFSSLANSKECDADLSEAAVCAFQQIQTSFGVPFLLYLTFITTSSWSAAGGGSAYQG